MAKQTSHSEHSPSKMNDETPSSSDNEQKLPPNVTTQKDSIRNYITNVLQKHGTDDEQQANLAQAQIRIDTAGDSPHGYENVSAFRQYHTNTEGVVRTGAERRGQEGYISDDDLQEHIPSEQVSRCLTQLIFLKSYFN
jgi:hypothetical protein